VKPHHEPPYAVVHAAHRVVSSKGSTANYRRFPDSACLSGDEEHALPNRFTALNTDNAREEATTAGVPPGGSVPYANNRRPPMFEAVEWNLLRHVASKNTVEAGESATLTCGNTTHYRVARALRSRNTSIRGGDHHQM
jgi:hypothetical protein